MASGLVGLGRFVEPPELFGHIRMLMGRSGMAGMKVVVTAGGTQEPIDPVRVITNKSSGKQGYALAQAVIDAGGTVVLITTPTGLVPPVGERIVPVVSAEEMKDAVLKESSSADALVSNTDGRWRSAPDGGNAATARLALSIAIVRCPSCA